MIPQNVSQENLPRGTYSSVTFKKSTGIVNLWPGTPHPPYCSVVGSVPKALSGVSSTTSFRCSVASTEAGSMVRSCHAEVSQVDGRWKVTLAILRPMALCRTADVSERRLCKENWCSLQLLGIVVHKYWKLNSWNRIILTTKAAFKN